MMTFNNETPMARTSSPSPKISRDIQTALDKSLLNKFQSMSPSHQREWINAIDQAKKTETRARRIAQLLAKLRINK